MSDIEAHKGKLVPMNLKGDTLEERAKEACTQLNIEATGAHESFLACLRDRGYRKAYIRGETIYEIQNTELDAHGFTEATPSDDGIIDYVMLYYNGGVSFDEALDSAMRQTDYES